jgi:hypothetical protein
MKYGLADTKSEPNNKPKPARTKVLVALSGFDATTSQPAATAQTYSANRAAYGARKEAARSAQKQLLLWLDEVKGNGSYRKASTPTAFGTFTLEVTEELIALLESAPEVESVIAVADAPMELIGKTPAPVVAGT